MKSCPGHLTRQVRFLPNYDEFLQFSRSSIGTQANTSKPITDLRNHSWSISANLAQKGLDKEGETFHLHDIALQSRPSHSGLSLRFVGSNHYYPVKGIFSPRNKTLSRLIVQFYRDLLTLKLRHNHLQGHIVNQSILIQNLSGRPSLSISQLRPHPVKRAKSIFRRRFLDSNVDVDPVTNSTSTRYEAVNDVPLFQLRTGDWRLAIFLFEEVEKCVRIFTFSPDLKPISLEAKLGLYIEAFSLLHQIVSQKM